MSVTTLSRSVQIGYTRRAMQHLYRHKATATSTQTVDVPTSVKPFSEVPGPKGLPVVGTMFETMKFQTKLYELFRQRHEEYGPIYKEKLGNLSFVFLNDVTAFEQLLRQDSKYPARMTVPQWTEYREKKDINKGLFLSDGEQWHTLRRVVDKHMLKIKTVESYAGEFNKVVADFLERLGRIRTADGEIPSLNDELFNWSLESVGSILYEKRLGCLSDNRSQDTQDFIQGSHDLFEATKKLLSVPPNIAKIFMSKTLKEHDKAWDTLFRVAFKTIDERIKEIKETASEGEHVGFITHFMKEDNMTIKDVYANISELMGAAVDTTSNTTVMALYEISRNPQIQDAILEEVNRVVPPGEQPVAEHLRQMHYIKAVVKETLRMYPIALGVNRLLQEDAVLLGYHVPKGNAVFIDMIAVGRSANYYEDPETFRPERWLRDQRTQKPHPFAWLPFGFGPRMCIGRRVAELEMHLLISQLVRQFRLEPVTMEPVEIVTRLLLLPKDSIRIRAHERK